MDAEEKARFEKAFEIYTRVRDELRALNDPQATHTVVMALINSLILNDAHDTEQLLNALKQELHVKGLPRP